VILIVLSPPQVEVEVDLTTLLEPPVLRMVVMVVQAVELVIRHQPLDMEQEILHRHRHLKATEVAALALVLVVLVAEVVLELLELMEGQDLLEEMGERVPQMFMRMDHRVQ
tara:strand:- start:149 stop:481 length:333 start_codon:yes stop_codon:yes gene_type:complete